MSTIAQPALRRARRARTGRSAFRGGVLWIVLVAALLAGVVAINVLVLRLNVQLDDLRHDRAELDHHRVHLPVRVAQVDLKKRLCNPQMGCRTDREKFREAFDNAEDC
mgnify:CR=1 FL=1